MAKKDLAKADYVNDKDNLDLYDTIVREWASDAVHFTSEKQKRLAHYLALGIKPRQAALRAGYSMRYANSGVYELLKINKKFRGKVDTISKNFRESYLEFSQSMLPDIAWIERRELQELIKDPDRLNAVNAKVMRDIKRTANVLESEYGPTINYHQIGIFGQQIVQAIDEGKQVEWGTPDQRGMCQVTIYDDEDEVVDAEVEVHRRGQIIDVEPEKTS
jgi:hypothetical protein